MIGLTGQLPAVPGTINMGIKKQRIVVRTFIGFAKEKES